MARPARLQLPTSSRSFQLFATQANLTPRTRLSHDGESELDAERTSLLSIHPHPAFDPSSPFDEEDDVYTSFSSAVRHLDLLGLAKCSSVVCGALVASVLIVLVLMSLTNPNSNIQDEDYTGTNPAANVTASASVTSAFKIDYSMYSTFPLTPLQYEEECWKQIKEHGNNGAYWFESVEGFADVPHPPTNTRGVCSSSITYMLDGSTSGLVSELAIMAQAAALARERGSAFFVSDKHWNRGRWSDYFEPVEAGPPGGEPGCVPPPPEELTACPRLARHWVITFRTAKFHFGGKFADQYENPQAHGIQRQRPIYERSRSSFLYTIRPNARLRKLISSARADLLPDAMASTNPDGSYISVHIRRGDMRSQSWAYRGLPVPVPEFVEAVVREEGRQQRGISQPIFVASDDATSLDEFSTALQAKPGIHHNVVSLRTSRVPELRALAYPSENKDGYRQVDWDDDGIWQWSPVERVRYTSGMIVDLALLTGLWADIASQMPGATVCTIKSTICKMMAVGLGFDRAFDSDKGLQWIEIDAKGTVEPVWEAFSLSF